MKKECVLSFLDKSIVVSASLIPVGFVMGNVFEVFLVLSSLLWLIKIAIEKRNPLPELSSHLLFYPAVLWVLSLIISLAINGAGELGFWHDFAYLRFLFFLCAVLDTSKRVSIFIYFFYALIFSVFLALACFLSAYFTGYDLFGSPLSYYTGKGKRAINFSVLLCYASPFFFSIGYMGWKSKINKFYLLFGLFLFCFLVVFKIRTAILSALLGIVFILFYFLWKKTPLLLAALVLTILGILLYIIMLNNINNTYFESICNRIAIWKVSFIMWQDNPIFGVSVSRFRDIYQETYRTLQKDTLCFSLLGSKGCAESYVYFVHNLFLEHLTCAGIIGFISLIWLCINTIRVIVQNINTHIIFISFPVVFFFNAFTGWGMYQAMYGTFIFYLLALVGGTTKTEESFIPDSIRADSPFSGH
jgi:O-antigen ligase